MSGQGARPSSSVQDEALDFRVNKLEAQVHTLSRRLDSTALEVGRLQSLSSPRSSTFPEDITSTPQRSSIPPVQADIMRNAQTATANLERVNPSFPRSSSNALVLAAAASDPDIEEIPRPDMPSSSSAESPVQSRTVSLTGNYKIPLPSTLSTDDVRAIKDGVFAAGSIAKEITAALRGSDTASVDDDVAGTETPKTPGNWARLIEGASQLVQKAAQAIEVDAAVEATGSSAARYATSSAGGSASASHSQQAQTKWRKKTGVKTEGGPSGTSSPTPDATAGGSGSKGKGKMPAGPGRSTSWAAGGNAKVV